MSTTGQRLFDLLPALYRLKDSALAPLTPAERTALRDLQVRRETSPPLDADQQRQLDELIAKARGPLESLIMLVGEQLSIVAEDINQLYDDQFIETCAPWVIPYIGELIGYQPVRGVAPAVASPRAEVAHTISFRRRKGTILAMEQLARDVTGWGAHAVEMFKVLADTQYMNHIRSLNHYAPDLRRWKVSEYMETGFDRTAHKIDVRRIAIERGKYNIQNVGIFLWSLSAYSLTNAPATKASPQCFRFSPLGCDMPLFNHPISQGSDIATAAGPKNVPNPLRRNVLCQDIRNIQLGKTGTYYGAGNSLELYIDDKLQRNVNVCDLSGDDGNWINLPTDKGLPAVDPQLGRIALPPGYSQNVRASFYYGFNAGMGGGEYPRKETFTASPEQLRIRVPGDLKSVHEALDALGGDGVVEITDNQTYSETLSLVVKAGGHVELRAAEGCRPTLLLQRGFSITGEADASCDLNGLLIAYAGDKSTASAILHVPALASDGGPNQLTHLGLTHCTLVPGWALMPTGRPQPAYAGLPTLWAEAPGLEVVIQKSVVGGLWIGIETTANLADSVVDATDMLDVAYVAGIDSAGKPRPGGALKMTGCTVIGKVHASLLSLVSDCIVWAQLSSKESSATPRLWNAPLWAIRKQDGCVRFSYLPVGAIVPRQFQCVQQGEESLEPRFYSLRYGEPGYAKLLRITDDAIRRGAHDGGEMGAFHFVFAPFRETDLRVRIREYLPVGLEFGVFYEN